MAMRVMPAIVPQIRADRGFRAAGGRGAVSKQRCMRRAPAALLAALTASVALTACGNDEPATATPPSSTDTPGPGVSADLLGPDGATRGTVALSFDGEATVVDVRATGLTPGPHGFHVHKTGKCEPKSPDPADPSKTGDFLSAAGHLAEEGQTHGTHTGDLPSLIAGADGTATLTTTMSDLSMDAVLDADGSAVMVHALPDNFGNVPDRYAAQGVDDTTKKTGDAGARVACAALTQG
jgi:Cu-Zn family superoxide dismutase